MKEMEKFDIAVAVETTQRCNLHCKTCFQRDKNPVDMPFSLAKKIIDYAIHLKEYISLKNVMITLTGGEPLLYPFLVETATYAHERGLVTSLVTNGTLFSRQKAEHLKTAGVNWIAVSLDGHNQEILSTVRDVDFDKVIKAITTSIDCGFYTSISYTITKTNRPYLRDIVELMHPLGLDQIHFNHFVPIGRGSDNSPELALDIETNKKVQTQIRHLFIEYYYKGLYITSGCPTFGLTDTKYPFRMEGLLNPTIQGVQVPKCTLGYNVTVTPTGEVIPCIMLRSRSLGNINESDLISVWNDSLSQEYRKGTYLKGKCKICEYDHICRGCRGRALGMAGDAYAEDPLCWHTPQVMT
ncbi:MAG: radical SAM protein [Theionarchaea archaeon]|nr:radical SAM protein [Theionarchaea archaeon]